MSVIGFLLGPLVVAEMWEMGSWEICLEGAVEGCLQGDGLSLSSREQLSSSPQPFPKP